MWIVLDTAAEIEAQVAPEVKSARFDRLLALQNAISLEKNQPLAGATLRVLCDGVSKNNDAVYQGRTEGGKIVFFDGSPELEGRFLTIHIDKADTFALYGKITEK